MPTTLKLSFALIFFSILVPIQILAQECACPPQTSCKPCSGGYTSLTLRYDGNSPALVLIIDGTKTLANLTVSPSQEFKISGSKRNEKFADKLVPVLVNGIKNTALGSSCLDVQVGLSYGSFTVVAAASMGGSIVCCTAPPPDFLTPMIGDVPENIEVEATKGCGSQVFWTEPITTDNCSIASVSSTHISGEVFPIGITNVVYSATDNSGNITTSSFTVTVTDKSAPVFTSGPTDIVLPSNELCTAIASWSEPVVRDECDVTIIRSHAPNTSFTLGRTKVQYEARDGSGNSSYFSFNVIVNDVQPPVFTSFPSDQIISLSETDCKARVTWINPQVSDQCSGATLTSSHQSGTEFPVGINKITFYATDEAGNRSEKHLTITVEDKRNLTIDNCPNDIQLTADEGQLTKVSWLIPVATAKCDVVDLTSSHDPGDLFRIGNTVVEYTAKTPSGKSAYCSFTVSIAEAEKPLQVSKLVTPDGDGLNDEWVVVNIEDYRDNQVMIIDRWGGVIFQASRYDNESVVWKGTNKSGISVPTGTYFYTIVASNGKKQVKEAGAIELVR